MRNTIKNACHELNTARKEGDKGFFLSKTRIILNAIEAI